MARKDGSDNFAAGFGTRSGAALIEDIRADARALWEKGDLQQAGKDLVRGKIGLSAAVDAVVSPGTKIIDGAFKAHSEVITTEARADRELAEALKARRTENRSRAPKRGGRYGSVVHGKISDEASQPLEGVVVEARRFGTKIQHALAVDVTDARGVFQLVLKDEDLGKARAPRVTLHAGLDRDRPVLESATSIAVKRGAAVEHSMVMREEIAGRVRFALERREETDRARLTELQARATSHLVEKDLAAKLGEALKEVLKELP